MTQCKCHVYGGTKIGLASSVRLGPRIHASLVRLVERPMALNLLALSTLMKRLPAVY